MDQSGYKKDGDDSDTTWDINYIRYIYMSYIKGSFSIMYRRKDRLSFVEWLQPCRNKRTSAVDLFPNCHTSPHHNSAVLISP